MTEKKQLVFDLRLNYTGPVSIEEFYAEVEKWMSEKGMQKDLKRKSEELTSKGKIVEWIVECWKSPVGDVKEVVRLRALFDKAKEIKLNKKGRSMTINQADVSIVIDGFLETKLRGRWTQKPVYSMFRTLYDKYIWAIGSTITERNEAPVAQDCYDLHKRLKAFFSLYKMKVA